jgi:hypothetical protein
MKRLSFLIIAIFLLFATTAYAGLLDDVMKTLGSPSRGGPDDSTIISGLKEALSIGTDTSEEAPLMDFKSDKNPNARKDPEGGRYTEENWVSKTG